MEEIDNNLNAKNRDRMTSNVAAFKRDVNNQVLLVFWNTISGTSYDSLRFFLCERTA